MAGPYRAVPVSTARSPRSAGSTAYARGQRCPSPSSRRSWTPTCPSDWRGASAATGWDRCPKNRFCIFEHPNGQGKYAYFNGNHDNLANPIGGFNFNDKASSIWNRTAYGFGLWRDKNQKAHLGGVRGSTGGFNLPARANDKTSSISIGTPQGNWLN
jgi:hypothetical protein